MAQTYKVKLESGRVLGPLDLERVRLLILKNRILGRELARAYPDGDWVKITAIHEIADLLIAHAAGRLDQQSTVHPETGTRGSSASTHILPGATEMFPVQPSEVMAAPPSEHVDEPSHQETSLRRKTITSRRSLEDDPQTVVGGTAVDEFSQEDKTAVSSQPSLRVESPERALQTRDLDEDPARLPSLNEYQAHLAHEETVMIGSSNSQTRKKKQKATPKEMIKATIAAIALGIAGYQVLFPTPQHVIPAGPTIIRPTLPSFPPNAKSHPRASEKTYAIGMKEYVLDNVLGYRLAAAEFSRAATLDPNNVKALAMLASSYLNLIDSSNKDENYFSVISKLIQMTRAKNEDLPETVIADVEFYCVINKPQAAENRIIRYTRDHPSFGLEMYYYLALAFYTQGDYESASHYVSQIPDNKAFGAKVFYLEGRLAEKLDDNDDALIAYRKALQIDPYHAKSRLRIADIMNQRGKIKQSGEQLEFLVAHRNLLSPKELGRTYYLHSLLSADAKKFAVALSDAERAVQLDKEDHDYLLQLYTMRAKAGESIVKLRKSARMYYFLGEGERLLKKGKYQDALTEFLQAREANSKSPIPLVKIGDMFRHMHDLANARLNYKMAADRAPKNIDIWSKYIDVLIQSYEWAAAQKAMARFRQLPVSQSAIDKAAGDIYEKQGQYAKAQYYYRRAMARDSIDSEVYIAYAKSLMATHNYKEAPFFFALARRYDPLNVDAILGTAKCIANTESVDRAIEMLRDELQRGSPAKAELLGGIADYQIQQGQWDAAQSSINAAMQANPDYAYPWKLQAEIYLNHDTGDRRAVDKALEAYESYSERDASDPSGYLARFRIFEKKGEYDKADNELNKIFGIYPKYPNLHYYKGALYGLEGNHKKAIEEYRVELQNNPGAVEAMLALGKEYVQLGAYRQALKQFNKAMLLAPQSADPKQLSGWANFLLKNYSGAVALYQEAIKIDSGNPLIYKRLGLAYRALGDQQNAMRAFRKYLTMEPDAPDRAEILRYQ